MEKPVLLWSLAVHLAKKEEEEEEEEEEKEEEEERKKKMWVVRKVRTDILLADLLCFEVQCLLRSAHLKKSS